MRGCETVKRRPWTWWVATLTLWGYVLVTAGYGFYRILQEVSQ